MKKIITTLAGAAIVLTAAAQPGAELKRLVRQSFAYFPKIQEMGKATAISELRTSMARGGYLPVVAGNASYSYIDPVGEASFPVSASETRTIQFQPHDNYNANIGLQQVIWDFGRTQSQIDKANYDMQTSQYNADAARAQLASQVAGVYYGLIYLSRATAVQDSVIAFYEKNKRMVEGRIRQGDALQIDLSNTVNSIEQEKGRRVEFQRLYARQLALLAYVSGQAQPPAETAFTFMMPAGASAVDQNPEVLAAAQRVASSQAEIKLAQRQQLPSLNLVANAGFRNGYQPDINETRFNYLAGATLSVPIFQGRKLRQAVAITARNAELQEFARKNLESSVQRDLASAMADEEAYTAQIHHADAQIAAATEALRLNRVRYERGVSTYLDLVYASTNLQRALLNKLQYEYQRCLAQVEHARAAGIRFWEE